MAQRQVIFSTLLTVLSVFCLAVLWEFWLEPENGNIEAVAEKWEFVVTSVAFSAIALIVPSLISLRNIAGRARAEIALRYAKDSAEIANRAKSEFLAAMRHELRTPLNAIIGFSEIIQSETFGPVGSVKYCAYAEDINDSGQHLLALINDILDLSKVESGLDELYEEDIEVPAVIQSVLRLVQQRGGDGGLALELDFPDNLPLLRGDKRKLKQILVNLLTNAIKFTDASGKVTLRAWCRADSDFVFQIIDTGIGIAAKDIPKALSRFGQVDGDLNRQYQGTGLGLPLTKALVELHGGNLTIDSVLGVGTTVTVVIPSQRVIDRARSAA